jgi:hypothetical protein
MGFFGKNGRKKSEGSLPNPEMILTDRGSPEQVWTCLHCGRTSKHWNHDCSKKIQIRKLRNR